VYSDRKITTDDSVRDRASLYPRQLSYSDFPGKRDSNIWKISHHETRIAIFS